MSSCIRRTCRPQGCVGVRVSERVVRGKEGSRVILKRIIEKDPPSEMSPLFKTIPLSI